MKLLVHASDRGRRCTGFSYICDTCLSIEDSIQYYGKLTIDLQDKMVYLLVMKEITPVSSLWKMTISERNNAATFIHNTTVRPFMFMGAGYKCFYCSQYYSDITLLLQHTSTHTTESEESIIENYIPFGKRMLKVDISNLKCRKCNKVFSNLDSIKEHLQKTHKIHFYPVSSRMTEYNMETINGMFVCHICNKNFENFPELNVHMTWHVGKAVCESCGATFLNQSLLMRHKDKHLVKPFPCEICKKVFYKRSQYLYHNQIVHKGKDRVRLKKCPHCPKTFKEYYTKMLHLKDVHGIVKAFDCQMCKATFTMKRRLTEHITKNHTEKHKCEVCSKCFGTEGTLKSHMPVHTGSRNFVCPICKKAYRYRKSLRRHKCAARSTTAVSG